MMNTGSRTESGYWLERWGPTTGEYVAISWFENKEDADWARTLLFRKGLWNGRPPRVVPCDDPGRIVDAQRIRP